MILDTALVLIVLTGFVLLASSRLGHIIRTMATQGVLLALLPLLIHEGPLTTRVGLVVVATLTIKGLVLPKLLLRTLRTVRVKREIEPFVGYTTSILLGVLGLVLSVFLASRLPLAHGPGSSLAVPVAFSTMLTGLLLIVSRKKALTQVIGYLVAENGIFCLGTSLLHDAPVGVELGILLDVLVAVLVMGIAIHHIQSEFDSIDVHRIARIAGKDNP